MYGSFLSDHQLDVIDYVMLLIVLLLLKMWNQSYYQLKFNALYGLHCTHLKQKKWYFWLLQLHRSYHYLRRIAKIMFSSFLSLCLSNCLSIHPSIRPSVCISASACLSFRLSVCLSVSICKIIKKTQERMFIKFSGEVGHSIRHNWPVRDHHLDTGFYLFICMDICASNITENPMNKFGRYFHDTIQETIGNIWVEAARLFHAWLDGFVFRNLGGGCRLRTRNVSCQNNEICL